jgi:hypothetical protein
MSSRPPAAVPLSSQDETAVAQNIFPAARPVVGQVGFPWHRDSSGRVTACRKESSQALAIDFFGTIQRLESRDRIIQDWVQQLALAISKQNWTLEPEVCVPRTLLGEPRPTQIDYLASGIEGLVLFECKFTEPDGGSCSQPKAIASGAHRGLRQCNGNYEIQVNPVTGQKQRCALTAKGVRYWDLVSDVMRIDPAVDHRSCPFSGGWYQWMRNLVAARALSIDRQVPGAFVVVYADGPFPMASKAKSREWGELVSQTEKSVIPLRSVSYQSLLSLSLAAASADDRKVLQGLESWMKDKIAHAGRV